MCAIPAHKHGHIRITSFDNSILKYGSVFSFQAPKTFLEQVNTFAWWT